MTELPKEFLEDIEEILKDEYDDFIKSYEESKTTGLRINTLKIDKKKLFDLELFDLNQIPWAEEGFYYDDKIDRPGRNPLHEAGAYYLQEPSAMSVIPKADIKEGEKVLDMCAAPGGKSTYILSKLNDTGLLVSNEINASRIKALGENLERFGARNCIITNTDSNSLRKTFNGYFDKVIIDAPCSGQGMFRKDEVAISDWSYAKVVECQSIQKEIIRDGYKMLKKDGILIYSTCTFSREENEHVINEFISEYPHAELIELKIKNLDKEIKDYREFEKKFLKVDFYSNKKNKFYLRGENLYLLPEIYPDTKKLKVLRYGLHLGVLKKNRFEPSHALSHYLKVEDVKNVENFSVQSESILKYLKGDVVNSNDSRGWVLVSVEGIPLGWGKESSGVIKNHYPKGLRKVF